MTATIVLINLFEVPSGTENEFLEWWKKCSEALKSEPGFIDATLHRKLKPDTRFQYINVAHWETEESLNVARTRNQAILRSIPAGKGEPAIYEVALAY